MTEKSSQAKHPAKRPRNPVTGKPCAKKTAHELLTVKHLAKSREIFFSKTPKKKPTKASKKNIIHKNPLEKIIRRKPCKKTRRIKSLKKNSENTPKKIHLNTKYLEKLRKDTAQERILKNPTGKNPKK